MHARSLSLLTFVMVGCGDDGQTIEPDAIDYTLGEAPALAMPCTDSPSDVYTLPTLPAMDDSRRGDVFRCAITEKITVPDIKALIEADNAPYPNAIVGTVNSGFWTYRIAYRSTRNTVGTARAEGDTAAVLLVPAKPIAGAPLVVWGHGSTGIAPKCAPSRLDLTAAPSDQDYPPMLYRLAGYGYTVIAPDYNGFSYGQAPGYFNAEDEAHAILDATRAAAKILPDAPDKVVFVGHSQGGHAVFAAHSYAKSYGMQGQLVGVAGLAPMWMSMSLWAAATTGAAGLTTATDVNSILYAMQYAYAAGELRDGTGVSVFQAAKQTAAKDAILAGECYDAPKLQALGATPADFFDMTYVDTVGYTCAANPFAPDCTSTEAAKWKARWIEDRPPLDPQGAPIIMFFGAMDTFITPGRAECARAKLAADGVTQAQTCYNDVANHRDIIRGQDPEYLNRWIAAKAGAGTDPGACAAFPVGRQCATPPNDY
ncbi:MAG TPA: lipase family protein [Kofleriaceae bacterium]